MEFLQNVKNSLKKKMMQVVVKTTLGRFLKSVTNDHIRNVTYFDSKVQFQLQNLDIKESVMNDEILSETPFRMIQGTINSISGDVAVSSPDARNLRMEGLSLVFYVNPNTGAHAACTEGERRRATDLQAEQQKRQNQAQKNALFSSMLVGNLSRENLQEAILEDVAGATADDQQRAIDASVDALSNTIKSLVHSFQATVEGVNIRLIVPPLGVEITSPPSAGGSFPQGCVELVINIEKEIQLLDANSAAGLGNSFHKRIRFSGIRLLVFNAGASTAVETETEVVEQLDIGDTVVSGDVSSMENELDLQFFDGDVRQKRSPKWVTKLSINQVHCILSPQQLTRMSQVIQGVLAAPRAGSAADGDNAESEAPDPDVMNGPDPSKFTCTCSNMSLTILQPIDEVMAKDVIRAAWRSFRDDKRHVRDFSAMPPHYAIECSGTKLLLCTTTVATNPDDDQYHRVFEAYGGRYLSVGLRQIVVAEKRSSSAPPSTLIRHGAFPSASSDGSSASKQFNVVLVLRSTCPMSPAVARGCGVDMTSADLRQTSSVVPRNVVRHDVLLNVQNTVELFADVEIADRLLAFWKCLQMLVKSKRRARRSNGTHRARRSDEDDDDDDDLLEGQFERVSESDVSALGTAATALEVEEDTLAYDNYTTVTVEIARVQIGMSFPATRRPDASVYGPLTQRLFGDLCRHLGVPLPAAPTERYAGNEYISKGLEFVLEATKVHLPRGDASQIHAFMTSATLALVDLARTEPPQLLARVVFAAPADERSTSSAASFGLAAAEPPLKISIAADEGAAGMSVRPSAFSARSPLAEMLIVENGMFVNAMVSVDMTIHHFELWLHQDDYLLIVFMINEVVECMSSAVRIHLAADADEDSQKEVRTIASNNGRRGAEWRGSSLATSEAPNSQASFYTCISETSSPSSIAHQQRSQFLTSAAVGGSTIGQRPAAASSAGEQSSRRFGRSMDSVDTDRLLGQGGGGGISSSHALQDALMAATAVRLKVLGCAARVYAPRLSASGDAVAQPLWMTLKPEERRLIDASLLYHAYDVAASGANIFLYLCTTVHGIGHTSVNVRAESLAMHELLCTLPSPFPRGDFFTPPSFGVIPRWGSAVPLLRSFATLHNRSYNVQHPSSGHALVFTMSRVETVAQVTTVIDLSVDRVSALHQAAHPGDHWLFVLMNFFMDNPVPSTTGDLGDEPAVEDAPGDSVFVKPSTTHVTLTAANILLQYQPFGRDCKLVAMLPHLRFDTGVLLSTTPKSVMHVSLDKLSIFVHQSFPEELLEYDDASAQHSAFGLSQKGLAADLEALGFVHVLSVASSVDERTKHNVIVRTEDVIGKPLVVEITGLAVELATANDSFYFFNLIATHFGASVDATFLPSPYHLVAASSERYECVQPPSKSNPSDPVVSHLVDNLQQRIESLLGQRIGAPRSEFVTPQPSFASSPGSEGTGSTATPHMPIPSVRAPTRATSDEFEDIHDEVQNNERAPHWTSHMPTGSLEETPDATGSIASLFANNHYLSAFNPDHMRLGAQSKALPLVRCPPIATEIVVYDCQATVTLFGGTDFDPHRRPSGDGDASAGGQFSELDNFFRTSIAASGRILSEKVVAKLSGVFVQVDMFEEGHAKCVHLLLRAKDVEVFDCIETSPVRTLIMCSIPRNLRDRDGHVFELKWTTVLPGGGRHGASSIKGSATEEQVSIRLLPLVVSIHRRAIDLFLRFTETPEIAADGSDEPSTLFFNKIFIHPIQATVNVYFEVKDYSKALHGPMQGNYYELANMLPQIEGSRLRTPPLLLSSFPLGDFAERFLEAIGPHFLRMDAIVLLLCGVQPVRSITETGSAVTELLLAPLEHYKRNKSLFLGISKGLRNFSRRVAAETLRVASGTTRVAHEALHSVTGIARQGESLHRGSQPAGAAEGLSRAAAELSHGVAGASEIVSLCLADGHIERIPLALLAPVDGTMRALTQALLGLRNSIRPEQRALEIRMYKSEGDEK